MRCYLMSKKYKRDKRASKVSFKAISKTTADTSKATKRLAQAVKAVAESARNAMANNTEVTTDGQTKV